MKTVFLLSFSILLFRISYSQQTYVPDDGFENALIYLGYDTAPLDNYVTTANISSITELNLDYKQIADLTGIEDFISLTTLSYNSDTDVDPNFLLTSIDLTNNIALTHLSLAFHNLTSLDLSNNTNLTYFVTYSNPITSLDLSNNTALTYINCNGNQLTSLDLSSNSALTHLDCGSNPITSLDLSNNTALTYLKFVFTPITNIDVSSNVNLTYFSSGQSDLISLDLSNNAALTTINCSRNNLTSLNIQNGNNTNLISFTAKFNPDLECIQVDDVNYSNTNWINNIDSTASYSLECNSLSNENFVLENFKLYPNPTSKYLNIELIDNSELKKVMIYNNLGQLILEEVRTKIDISNFSKNIYYIEIVTNKGKKIKKFIVK